MNKLSARSALSLMFSLMLAVAVSVTACAPGDGAPSTDLAGKRVAVLITVGFDPTETNVPVDYLGEKGADVVIVSYGPGPVAGRDSREVMAELGIADVVVDDFDCLIVPGGESPFHLRNSQPALELVRRFAEEGRLVAALCAGPRLLIAADVVEGRKITGSLGTMAEAREAGAEWDSGGVVRDGNIITGQGVGATVLFAKEIAEALVGPQ